MATLVSLLGLEWMLVNGFGERVVRRRANSGLRSSWLGPSLISLEDDCSSCRVLSEEYSQLLSPLEARILMVKGIAKNTLVVSIDRALSIAK